MITPDRFLGLPDLSKEFPVLGEWFENPTNQTAQLQEGDRLKSAEEKMELVGGSDKTKTTMNSLAKRWRNFYLILQACKQEPMMPWEIVRFGQMVGARIDLEFVLYHSINLRTKTELARVDGLTYIARDPKNPNLFNIHDNKPGYLTTPYGLKVMARNFGWS